MIIKNITRTNNVNMGSDQSFGIVFTCVFAIIAIWPLFYAESLRYWAFGVGAVFLIVAFVKPVLLKPLNYLWFRFGILLHKVVNPLVMSVLFYLVITPMGIGMRLFGRDELALKRNKNIQSYWIERDPPGPKSDTLRDQF